MRGVILKKANDNIICSIQIQVVILKRGVIQFGKHYFERIIANFRRFHYVHLTTCVRLEEIIDYQCLHLFSPVQLHGFFHNFIPVVLFTDEICGLLFVCIHLFRMVTSVL